MKTARLFFALFVLVLVGASPAFSQGTPPWEYWRDVEAPITDYNTTSSTIEITDVFTISSLQVMVDIDHTSANDLMITMSGPGGNYILSLYNGSVYDNFENTIFDPAVAQMPCSGIVPAGAAIPGVGIADASNVTAFFRGVYKPQPGTVFPTSGSPVGLWTINVYDRASGDVGTLRRWALIFNRYGAYKDVRIGWDINYWNTCGSAIGPRLPVPFVDDMAAHSMTSLYPYTVLGRRPQNGQSLFVPLIQNSKTASETRMNFYETSPTGTMVQKEFNLNMPLGFYAFGNVANLPAEQGTYRVSMNLFQRGDLFASRGDNSKMIQYTLTPGSLAYDNGVSQQTYNGGANDCEANVFEIEQDQTLTSVDVWQGSNVELEPTNSAARISVRVFDAASGVPGTQIATTGNRQLPIQGAKWVSYDFTPPIYLPAGRYAFGICTDVAPTTGGVGMGMDQLGSPFDINGNISRYGNHGIQFWSPNGGTTWNNDMLRQFGGKMIRPNFVTGADVGVIAILNPSGTNLPGSFSPVVRFGSFANHPQLPNAVTFGKVYITNSAGQQVYYSERRVTLSAAPYIADVTFDAVSGLASGSYTIKATIERADEENFINNSYSRNYVKTFAPVVVSHRGPVAQALRANIEAAFGNVEFSDRALNTSLPTEGRVLWIGTMNTDEAAAARAFAKAGNDFMVLPTAEYAGDVLSNVFSTVATADEQKSVLASTLAVRLATRPEIVINPQIAAMKDNAAAMVMSKDISEREAVGAKIAGAIAQFEQRIDLINRMPQLDMSGRNVSFSNSQDIRVEGLRVGDLSVAKLVPVVSAAPRQVVEAISDPTEFQIAQNYPNPFNPTTNIAFNLPSDAQVSIRVYDMLGRQLSTLVNATLSAGKHIVSWNSTNDAREVMPSGIYVYRMEATPLNGTAPVVQTKKMILSK